MSTPSITPPTTPPTLPPTTQLTLLAEGAANAVYRIAHSPSTAPGQLLRLRKAVPNAIDVATAHAFFTAHIAPLFAPAHLVGQTLVRVPAPVVRDANRALRAWEDAGGRDVRRRGVPLAEGGGGAEGGGVLALLVRDMSVAAGAEAYVAAELKPKWLVPSVGVEGARRCRTCAVRAMRAADGDGDGGGGGASDRAGATAAPPIFCPLDLASGERARVRRVVDAVMGGEVPDGVRARAAEALLGPLVARLRELQARLDPGGVPGGDVPGREFLTAMTLRDCTLFLKVPLDAGQEVEMRLGDLDVKSADRAGYWAALERRLIEEGWYAGVERGATPDALRCMLW